MGSILEKIEIENHQIVIHTDVQITEHKRADKDDTCCELLRETLHRSTDIKSLEIVNSELTSLAYKQIGRELYGYTQLQDLVLSNLNLSGSLGELLGPGIPSLVSIRLSCEGLTFEDIGSLAEALRRKRLPRLKHLDFSYSRHPFSTEKCDSVHDTEILTRERLPRPNREVLQRKRLQELKHLGLEEDDSGDEDCVNSTLKVMDFSYSTLSPENIARILHGAAPLSRMMKLDLTDVCLCGSLADVLDRRQTVMNFQESPSNGNELPAASNIVVQYPCLKELVLSQYKAQW